MNVLTIVALSIAALAVLITGLSLQVSRLRLRHRVSFGDGGHKDLLVAIRVHGNALEQSMLFAALALACAVLPGAPASWVGASAAVFVLARIVHVAAVATRRLGLRQAAHTASILSQLSLVCCIGVLAWGQA